MKPRQSRCRRWATRQLVATKSMTQKTCVPERRLDIDLSKISCSRTDHVELSMLERVLEHSGAIDEGSFFSTGCPSERINLQPHQRMQTELSTGTGDLMLASVTKRPLSC